MSDSISLQVTDAIVAALSAASVDPGSGPVARPVDSAVHRERLRPVALEQTAKSFAVYLLTSPRAPDDDLSGAHGWTENYAIQMRLRLSTDLNADPPDRQMDELNTWVTLCLTADRTLGGVAADTRLGGIDRTYEEHGVPFGVWTRLAEVDYRTLLNDPRAQA